MKEIDVLLFYKERNFMYFLYDLNILIVNGCNLVLQLEEIFLILL